MATIAEIQFPAGEFALRYTLETIEDVNFEVERIAAHDPEMVMPYIWATSADPTELERVLTEDTSVDAVRKVAQPADTEALYQMEWIDSAEALIHILVEEEGSILVAQGRQDGWFMRVLFPDRDALSQTYHFCEKNDLRLDLTRIYNVDEGKRARVGLTEAQEKAITAAYDHGYYEVPRGIDLAGLAAKVGVSHQALSERLRRGNQTLIENSVIIGQGGSDEEDA